METSVTIQDAALRKALSRASDDAYKYLYSAARRSVSRYRAHFLAGRYTRGVKLRGGKEGIKRFFRWEAKPNNEQTGRLEDIRVRFYTNSIVAHVHEHGAFIRPRRKRSLAIPTGFALTKNGRVKKDFRSPAKAKSKGYKLHFIPSAESRRRAYLAIDRSDMRGRNGSPDRDRLEVVFVLVGQVSFEPQLGFYDGWDKFQRSGEVDRRFAEEFGKYLRKTFGVRA